MHAAIYSLIHIEVNYGGMFVSLHIKYNKHKLTTQLKENIN